MSEQSENEFVKYAVKASGDLELDVLAIPFNSVDSDGQYFDADTDIMADNFNTPVILYQHGVEPNASAIQEKPVIVGSPVKGSLVKKMDGWHISVVIDKANALAQKIIDAAKRGMLAVSSGTVSHLARLDIGGKMHPYQKNKAGRIAVWAFAELSLWDMTAGNFRPANSRAYAVPALKAFYDEAGIPFPIEYQPEAQNGAADYNISNNQTGVKKMDEKQNGITAEQVNEQIAAALKAERQAQADALKDAQQREAEISAEVEKRVEAVKAEAAKARRLPDYGHAPYATKFDDQKFDNVSGGDLSLAIEVMRSQGKRVSELAIKSLAYKLNADKNAHAYVRGALKAAGLVDENAIKAAEVMASSDTGNGLEWVATAYSTELWRSIRHDGGIVGKLPEVIIPDGYSSQYFPVEDADPTWYKVAESTDKNATTGVPDASVPDSKAGTANKQMTIGKLGARVMYSGELTENSIVQFAPQLREQLALSGREVMEAIVINGDTATGATTNINDIGGTPAGNEWFLLADGFRKLALVTNTANSRSGTTLAVEDYKDTMQLMGTAGLYASDLSKLMFIVDPNVYFKNMELTEVKSRDYTSAAVVENGFVTRMYGVPVMPSWQMHKGATGLKANSAGKVDLDTQGNNTTGSILCVRPDLWKLGYKRRMTIETTRFANSDTWEIVALARFGLTYRDNESAAITYNLTV
jgi:hypothetical protein